VLVGKHADERTGQEGFGFGQARIAIAAMACSQLKLWNAATIASASTNAPIKGWAADSSLARRLARFRLHDGGAGIGVSIVHVGASRHAITFHRPVE
jgi:hypothetical protein